MSEPAPQSAEQLVQQARELMQQQQPDEAWKTLEASLAIAKTAPAYRNLGNILFVRREPAKAIPYFQQALDTDGGDHASYAMLAEAHFALGDTAKALGFSGLAIGLAPDEMRYKERFIAMSQGAVFQQHDEIIARVILACLATPGLDCSGLQGFWYNIFTLNPVYRSVYKLAGQDGGFLKTLKNLVAASPADFDAQALANVTDFMPLLRPYFLLGLEKITVYSKPFEDFIAALRKALLLQPARFSPPAHDALAKGVAQYALGTEYIIDITPEETAALAQTPSGTLQACYAETAESRRALDEARKTIPALTPIADEVSVKVREQYEESPYPKWKTVPRNLTLEAVAAPLRKQGAKILIAGCGTGHEAAQIASVLPEADILAVDLSLSSLAYAKLQTQLLGFKNIRFAQADILRLGGIEDRFDAVISGGVLHHLRDPVTGWQVLTGLLNPGGLMRIALYSATARRHITAAREAVARGNYPATPEGMRAFRRESRKLLDKDTLGRLMAVSDYYHISMYRDMVFHVQEHCFDIPGLETALKRLQLAFLKFILPQTVAAQYHAAFPGDAEGLSLGNWHKFEQAQPETFLGMYQFWCRKN